MTASAPPREPSALGLSLRRLLGIGVTVLAVALFVPALLQCGSDFWLSLRWGHHQWSGELSQFFGTMFLFPLYYLAWIVLQAWVLADLIPLLDLVALICSWRLLLLGLDSASYEPRIRGRAADIRPEGGLASEPHEPLPPDLDPLRAHLPLTERTWDSMTAWAPPTDPAAIPPGSGARPLGTSRPNRGEP